MKRVVVGLSGGVDSAVTAALLLQQGALVEGHWLDIGLGGREDAALVAKHLGIPFTTGDIRADLEEQVCVPFARDYLCGQTPLPCARCNRAVKFPALLRRADELGGAMIATGHYARVLRGEGGAVGLYRGKPSNDQSYMLARLTKEQLERVLFPLGEFEKTEVRQLALELQLPVAKKPDSMEICFIPDNDYAAWLERRGATPKPGHFIKANGEIIGMHKGIHHYTVGQRRGLGISAESRLFVKEIRPETDEVVLSMIDADLYSNRVDCVDLNLLVEPEGDITVRIRHSKEEYPAKLCYEGTDAYLELKKPARAPTAGQLAVFYQKDRVLGSGWIRTRGLI
ncbi:MAG: tRNA 2-thiouridine(34) synthase MnmA [Evtepia sp.]